MSGKTLYERLCNDPRILNSAWDDVRKNAKKFSKGVDDETLQQFSANSEQRLRVIRSQLKKNKFKFSNLRASSVFKKDGGRRPIQVSAIQDRVVVKAIESLIRDHLDNSYNVFNNPVSYAFIRSGDIKDYDELDPKTHKGVRGAVEKLKSYVEDGYTWYVKADIIDFFPSIQQGDVLKKHVFPVLPDKSLDKHIRAAFSVEVEISEDVRKIFGDKTDEKFEAGTGLPQGSILSPLFANVYLHDFDTNMSDKGYVIIRYVDDFLILCKSEKEAKQAFLTARLELRKLALKVHDPKTKDSKTVIGKTDDVTFLGIRLRNKKLYPSQDAFDRYIAKLKLAPKYSSLNSNLQYLKSLAVSWGATYSFCSKSPEDYEVLNKALVRATERVLYKSRVKALYSINSRQLRRLGLKKFDDAVAASEQRKKERVNDAKHHTAGKESNSTTNKY